MVTLTKDQVFMKSTDDVSNWVDTLLIEQFIPKEQEVIDIYGEDSMSTYYAMFTMLTATLQYMGWTMDELHDAVTNSEIDVPVRTETA
jgi:hypothetical protein